MIPKHTKPKSKLKRLGPKVRIPPALYEELIQAHGEVAYPGTLTDFALYLIKVALQATQREIQSTKLVQPASPQLAAKLKEKEHGHR